MRVTVPNVHVAASNVPKAVAGSSSFVPRPIKIETGLEEISAVELVSTPEGDLTIEKKEEAVEENEKPDEKSDDAGDNKENCDDNIENVSAQANVEDEKPDQTEEKEEMEVESPEVSAPGNESIPTISLLDASDDTGINACAECEDKASKKRIGNEVGSNSFIFSLFYNNGYFLLFLR